MPHQQQVSSIQKQPSIETRVYTSAIDALDVLRDTTTNVRENRGYSSIGSSLSVKKGTVAVQSGTVVPSERSEEDQDQSIELHVEERKENNTEATVGGNNGIQGDNNDDSSPHDGDSDDHHVLVHGVIRSQGRCTRLFQLIKRNPRRFIALVIFLIGIVVMSVYVDAIVEQRACFFLKPPYKNYKISATNENACTNFLPISTYYAPLNTSLINRHPNTVYNVVLFGDSMVDYACLQHNLTGKIISFLPQYATNLRFFNQGIANTLSLPYIHSNLPADL